MARWVTGGAGAVLVAVLGFEGDEDAVIGEVGLKEGLAAHEPVFADEEVNEEALGDADRLEFVIVLGGEFVEVEGAFAAGDHLAGVDAVFEGVHAGDAFALLGAGTGRFFCVSRLAAICFSVAIPRSSRRGAGFRMSESVNDRGDGGKKNQVGGVTGSVHE